MSTTGELHLRTARGRNRSITAEQYHMGTLRVFRPLYSDETGQVTYYVVNPGDGYPDGDSYLTEIGVLQGASAVLATQATTKIYHTPTCPVRQDARVNLEPRAVLELVPGQVIAYRESSYRQTTLAGMGPTATFMSLEVLTPGRASDGSTFGYNCVRLRTDTRVSDRYAVIDNLRLVPSKAGLTGLGGLEGHSHLTSFTVLDARVGDALVNDMAQMLEVGGMCDAVTRVQDPGFAAQALGDDVARLINLMLGINKLLRGQWFGAPRLSLRKYQQQPARLSGGHLPVLLSVGVPHA